MTHHAKSNVSIHNPVETKNKMVMFVLNKYLFNKARYNINLLVFNAGILDIGFWDVSEDEILEF